MQVAVTLRTEACYPELQVQDMLCEDLPKLSAWHMASVPALNSALAAAVPPHEAQLAWREQHEGVIVEELLPHLQPLALALGTVPLGTRRTVALHFVNIGKFAAAPSLFQPSPATVSGQNAWS